MIFPLSCNEYKNRSTSRDIKTFINEFLLHAGGRRYLQFLFDYKATVPNVLCVFCEREKKIRARNFVEFNKIAKRKQNIFYYKLIAI